MVKSVQPTARDDRGAILIHVALSILVLTGMLAFVLDHGMMWTARRQAQNAADAGALAAGEALIYDNYADRTSTGPAHLSGLATAQANQVMTQPATAVVDLSLTAGAWNPPGPQTCVDVPGSCAQASVFRDGTNTSTLLPTYFAHVFGQTNQKVRATATVQLLGANSNRCIKPWIAMDKSETTTYTLADVGTLLILRANAGPSSYRQADFNGSGADCPHGGGACYSDAILGCIGKPPTGTFTDGDVIREKPGNMTGPNNDGDAVWGQDPGASWNGTAVVGSCALTHSCGCANANGDGCANGMNGAISPRILAIALFKPSEVTAMASPGPQNAPIKNIAGVFMLKPGTGPDPICIADPNNFCGYLVPTPGTVGGGATPAPGNTLNVFLSLIR